MHNVRIFQLSSCLLALGLLVTTSAANAQNVDVASAEALLKDSKCAKCHSVDKKKDGPSFKATAAHYKGKSDAEAKLYKHLTTGPTIKIDGIEEEHTKVKSKDEAAVKNLVRYILTR